MIAGTVRDILLSVYLAAGIALTLVLIVAAFFITKALLGLIRAVKRPLEGFGEVADATVEHIAKPLREGVSIGNVAGNAAGFTAGFVSGFLGRMRRGGDGKDRRKR